MDLPWPTRPVPAGDVDPWLDELADQAALSAPTPSVTAMLTDTERDVLDFERSWFKYAGAKETAVRDRFGWSTTRHYQVLNALLDRPEALAHDPMTVRRLRRLREVRRQRRSATRLQLG